VIRARHVRSTCIASASPAVSLPSPARAGNRRFWRLSALRAHTKAPYKTDLLAITLLAVLGTLRWPKRPGRAGGPGQLSSVSQSRTSFDAAASVAADLGAPSQLSRARLFSRDNKPARLASEISQRDERSPVIWQWSPLHRRSRLNCTASAGEGRARRGLGRHPSGTLQLEQDLAWPL
jgi:hypothetical protein